jgi:hypothetical protein
MKAIARVDKPPVSMLPIFASLAAAQEPAVDAPVHAGEGPHVTGYLQLWGTVWDMDEDPRADPATYGDPEDDVGFKLRRVRLGVDGTESGVDYVVTLGVESRYDALDTASEGVGIEDALVVVHPYEPLAVAIGFQKVPVGREQLISSTDLALSERAVLSEWLVPGRDVGITGDWSVVASEGRVARVRVGAYNGNGSPLGDDNLGLLFACRLELARGGDAYATYGKVDRSVIGAAIDGYYDMGLATDEVGLGIDWLFRTGVFAAMGEVRAERIAPADTTVAVPDVPATTTRRGMLAQVGVTLGRWEPALRLSSFDDAWELEDNGDTRELAGGLTWHSRTDALRVGAAYVARLELAGAPLDNDTARLWLQLAL